MKREAFKMFLKPGFEEEYERRHAAIWPELKELLSKNGVYDYSIHVEHFGQRNGNRRVIWIHFHDVCHIVPPLLHDRIGTHVL